MTRFEELANKRKEQKAALVEKYGADFAEPARTIQINKAEETIINEWLDSLEADIRKLVKDEFAIHSPIYSFTATGLGYVLVVKESITGKELNVTQALDWFFFG